MNNLLKRTLTGSLYVAVVVSSLLTHPLVFAALIILFNLQSLREIRKMSEGLLKVSPIWIYINTLLLAMSLLLTFYNSPLPFRIIPLVVLIIYLLIQALYLSPDTNKYFLLWSVFSSIYITLPLVLLSITHFDSIKLNIPIVLLVFIIIWVNDSFAYLFGISFGKHRLFERISPKKSWEGFIGGLIMSLIASYIAFRIYPGMSLYAWLLFGLFTSLAGVFGDLIESMLKRSVNVKDSGTMLPGHGGVLDRIDSLLLVSPVIFLYLLILNY